MQLVCLYDYILNLNFLQFLRDNETPIHQQVRWKHLKMSHKHVQTKPLQNNLVFETSCICHKYKYDWHK